jgi:hypothetical protein
MRVRFTRLTLAIGVLATAAACDGRDQLPVVPSHSAVGSGTCAIDPDFVAHDRDSFLQALTDAQPGHTIALDGMIQIDFDGNVETAGLTFDCATPGSGLSAAPDVGLWLFIVKAPDVTVQNLVLDATNGYGAYLSDKNGVDAFAENLVFRGNTVRCSSPECVFVQSPNFAFASGALVDGNVVETTGELGIHIQGYTDVTVQGNTIRGLAASLWAIAVNGANHVHVRHNTTSGSWGRSLAMFDGVYDSDVQENTFAGVRVRGATFDAIERIQVSDNVIECGNQACIIATQGADVVVERNTFTSQGSATGVHTQGGLDRVRVSRNRIVATAPSLSPAFGAIRLRTGSGHVLEDNDIQGPWINGIVMTEVSGSHIARNVVVGATGAGGLFLDTHDSELRNNIVSRTGGPGTIFDVACRNLLLGNNLQGTGGVGVVFSVQTGANTYVGNQSIVVNDGAFDCDGDGIVDPNALTGQGTPLIGASVLRPAGVASTVDGLR